LPHITIVKTIIVIHALHFAFLLNEFNSFVHNLWLAFFFSSFPHFRSLNTIHVDAFMLSSLYFERTEACGCLVSSARY